MEVTFWGVRGSIPSPGPEFNRYGGNTPCVSVRDSRGNLAILDAGTGITVLGKQLMAGDFGRGRGEATLLLTHAHWDHIQGFPFFAPIYVPGNRITIFGPSESPAMVEGILEGQMDPHFSPIQSLRNLGATIDVEATQEGVPVPVGAMEMTARLIPHGRYSAVGYRLEDDNSGRSLVYAPDAGYIDGEPSPEVLELYRDTTVLIHDCTFSAEDQAQRRARGHSSIADAARVAAACSVSRLVMFHYDQDYEDDTVDRLERRCRELLDREPGGGRVQLTAAREGLTLEL